LVGAALTIAVRARLNHFGMVSLVEGIGNMGERMVYLCVGDHSLFLIDDQMLGVGEGFLYCCPYISLECCEVDISDLELFTLCIALNTSLVRSFTKLLVLLI